MSTIRSFSITSDFMNMQSPYSKEDVQALKALKPAWQHAMIRVRDPKVSVEFYEKNFGCKLVNVYHFPNDKFSLYFLATVPKELEGNLPPIGSREAHELTFNTREGMGLIELTHNHGTEDETDLPLRDAAGRPQMFHDGNSEPRGFGHMAFNVNDVYGAASKLEQNGVPFKKRPDEGRMKGIAFCLDPDGYSIELVPADQQYEPERFTFSQTMIRVKDAEKSVAFYRDLFGMELVRESHYDKEKGDFSLFFLASPSPELEKLKEQDPETVTKTSWDPCLELTWNHGTEGEPGPVYHNGNDTDFNGTFAPKGFGHTAFLVDDIDKFCDILEKLDVPFVKKPNGGALKKIAFVKDPTGYWVEIVQRAIPGKILGVH